MVDYTKQYAGGAVDALKNWASKFSMNPITNAVGTTEAAMNIGSGIASAPLALLRKPFSDKSTSELREQMTYQPRSEMGKAIPQAVGAITKPAGDLIGGVGKAISQVTPMNPDTGQAIVESALLAAPAKGIVKDVANKFKDAPAMPAAQAAQEFISKKTGLDWSRLPDAVRSRLTEIAKDQRTLDALDPKAIERQIQLESLPVPIKNASKGQLSRDPRQLQQEELLKSTTAGQELSQDALQQNRSLVENIDILKKRTAGEARGNEETGRTIQDKVLRPRMQEAQKAVNTLYEKARGAGETESPVDIKPLETWLENPTNRRNAPYLVKAIKDYSGKKSKVEAVSINDSPDVIAAKEAASQKGAQLSINDLEEIRKEASANSGSSDGATRHFAGQATRVIDSILDNSGANLYREARAAHKAMRTEFGDQASVSKLVEDKDHATRATALEDTYRQVVVSGSVEDLMTVRDSLKRSPGGSQAMRDLAAQTIDNIKEAATKGASNQAGEANATYNNLVKAVNQIGDEKLTVLIGKESTAQLRNIIKAAETLKTDPTGTGGRGSNTVNKILNLLDKTIVGKIPVVGDFTKGVVKGISDIRDLGKSTREVNAAKEQPLPENALKKNRPKGTNALKYGAAFENRNN